MKSEFGDGKVKELHIYLDNPPYEVQIYYASYRATEYAIRRHESVIHTTQPAFFRMGVHLTDGYDIHVHEGKEEIVLHDSNVSGYGKVRPAQSIYHMLMCGCFGIGGTDDE